MALGDVILDITFVFIGLFMIATTAYLNAAMLDPIANTITTEGDNIDIYGGEEIINELFTAATQWAPMTAGAALIAIGFIRAFRRARIATFQPPPGGPPPR